MKTNIIPVYLLIVISFLFSGYVFVKVQKLEKIAASNTLGVQAQAPAAPRQAPPEPTQNLAAVPAVTAEDHILGNRNADVVLVEYSDFECPFCKKFHPTMQQLMKDYGNKVAWVYRHLPLGFHQKAQKTAEATECANDLGGNDAFWKMNNLIFDKMPTLELTQLPDLAAEIGINTQAFTQCLDSGKYAQHVNNDLNGASKAGISGTPGTVIISKSGKRDFIGGAFPIESIKQQIDAVLK